MHTRVDAAQESWLLHFHAHLAATITGLAPAAHGSTEHVRGTCSVVGGPAGGRLAAAWKPVADVSVMTWFTEGPTACTAMRARCCQIHSRPGFSEDTIPTLH